MILILLCVAVYANSLLGGFVFDDDLIVNNPLFHSRGPLEFFSGGLFYQGDIKTGAGHIYRPLTLAIFRLTYAVFEARPFFFHLLPVFFHLATTLAVFFLFRRFFASGLAFALAVVFLIHPTNSEVVAYVSPLSEVLFVFFGMAAVLVAFGYEKYRSFRGFLILCGLLFLSLLSKETGILFCFLVGAIHFLFKVKNQALLVAPASAFLVYLFVRIFAAGIWGFQKGVTPIADATLFERLLSMPKVVFYYLSVFFFPVNLAGGQHWVVESLNFSDVVVPLVLVVLFFATVIVLWFRLKAEDKTVGPAASFFLVWIFLGFALHSQIIPLEYTVAQRWFYFTKIGLIGFLGAVFWVFAEYGLVKRFRNVLLVTFCLIILAFSVRTYVRNFDFKDNLTLASRDLAGNPDSFELELIYGTEQLKLKNYEEARLHLSRSVDLNPYRLNVNNLATSYLGLGETDQAVALFRKSAYEYGYYKSYENLASIYLLGGKLTESKAILDDAIALYPNDPKLWYILSLYFEKVGQEKEAVEAKERYLLLKGEGE